MRSSHPSDRQLVEWLDAQEDAQSSMPISSHIATCPSCSELVHGASEPIKLATVNVEPIVFELGLPDERVPDDIERGQVWRVRWEDTSQLAMVWNAEFDWVGMIPVTPDPEYADDSCIILTGDDGAGHSVLWLGLETPLPYHVLDRQVDNLTTGPVQAIRSKLRRGKPVDVVDVTMGQPIVSVFDDRYLYRSELAEDFGYLSEAEWAPTESGGDSLKVLAAAHQVELTDIAMVLELNPQDRLRLGRGLRPLTMREAERLIPLLGDKVTGVIECHLPINRDLVLALSKPKWRDHIDLRRRARGEDEVEGRRGVAYGVVSMAARADAAPTGEAAWDERIGLFFAA